MMFRWEPPDGQPEEPEPAPAETGSWRSFCLGVVLGQLLLLVTLVLGMVLSGPAPVRQPTHQPAGLR